MEQLPWGAAAPYPPVAQLDSPLWTPVGILCSVGLTSTGFVCQTKAIKDGRAVVVCTYGAIAAIIIYCWAVAPVEMAAIAFTGVTMTAAAIHCFALLVGASCALLIAMVVVTCE